MSTIDCLIWQTLASVMVPGFVIHKVVKVTKWATVKSGMLAKLGARSQFIPVAAGLAAIPFIVKPIDHGTDVFMDYTYRKIFAQSNSDH